VLGVGGRGDRGVSGSDFFQATPECLFRPIVSGSFAGDALGLQAVLFLIKCVPHVGRI
jgi:hypothetical protein